VAIMVVMMRGHGGRKGVNELKLSKTTGSQESKCAANNVGQGKQ